MSKAKDAFAALADPTRREILVLLRDQPVLNAGEIAARFPRISRPAVSKHLRVLRRAQLVKARDRGRERHYSLEPRSLAEVQEWFERFAPLWEESLARLKQQVEGR